MILNVKPKRMWRGCSCPHQELRNEWGQCNPFHISPPGWAGDADPLPGRISASGKRGVNALGECGRIGVVAGADDDSGMSALDFAMKADEIEAVQGEDGPVLLVRVGAVALAGHGG